MIGLLYAAVFVRGYNDYRGSPSQFAIIALLVAFGILVINQPWISRRDGSYPKVYLVLQLTTALTALSIPPPTDYFALLFVILSVQAMLFYPHRNGLMWVTVLTVAAASGLAFTYGMNDALTFIPVYAAANFFVASYSWVTSQAETARLESQTLLTQLQEAHLRLQDYTAQAEKLAVMEERNRLARELHDSVTQALYSQTLYAEAAFRQLSMGNIDTVTEHLADLRQTAQQSLQEMRLLIFELRPQVLEKEGLPAAIQARLDAVEVRSGLETSLEIKGESSIPTKLELELYRIAQESLNNVLKHSQAQQVQVRLAVNHKVVVLEIVDDGIGFTLENGKQPGGLGLPGIEERVRKLNGRFDLKSRPGDGTHLRVEVPL